MDGNVWRKCYFYRALFRGHVADLHEQCNICGLYDNRDVFRDTYYAVALKGGEKENNVFIRDSSGSGNRKYNGNRIAFYS